MKEAQAAEVSGHAAKRLLSVTCDAVVRLRQEGPDWPRHRVNLVTVSCNYRDPGGQRRASVLYTTFIHIYILI